MTRTSLVFSTSAAGPIVRCVSRSTALLEQDKNLASFLDLPAVESAGSILGTIAGLTGFRVGVYEVLEPIGTGGMGEVYRARDTKLVGAPLRK